MLKLIGILFLISFRQSDGDWDSLCNWRESWFTVYIDISLARFPVLPILITSLCFCCNSLNRRMNIASIPFKFLNLHLLKSGTEIHIIIWSCILNIKCICRLLSVLHIVYSVNKNTIILLNKSLQQYRIKFSLCMLVFVTHI